MGNLDPIREFVGRSFINLLVVFGLVIFTVSATGVFGIIGLAIAGFAWIKAYKEDQDQYNKKE